MRDENAKEFIVHIDNEQQTKLTPEEVVYEEDVDWFNRRVNEDSITGIVYRWSYKMYRIK